MLIRVLFFMVAMSRTHNKPLFKETGRTAREETVEGQLYTFTWMCILAPSPYDATQLYYVNIT